MFSKQFSALAAKRFVQLQFVFAYICYLITLIFLLFGELFFVYAIKRSFVAISCLHYPCQKLLSVCKNCIILRSMFLKWKQKQSKCGGNPHVKKHIIPVRSFCISCFTINRKIYLISKALIRSLEILFICSSSRYSLINITLISLLE